MKKPIYNLFLFSMLAFLIGSCQSDGNSNSAASGKITPKDPTQLLIGRWVDANDKNQYMIFNDEKLIRRNLNQEGISNDFYSFYEKCTAACQLQSVDPDVSKFSCFTVKENGTNNCYKITKLDGGSLEFTKFDGTGSAQVFKREK